MIFVKEWKPASLRGPSSFSLRLGCQLLGFSCLGFFEILSMSIICGDISCTWLGFSGGASCSELSSSSRGILLCRILTLFARRSLYIVVNLHRRLTSPSANFLDWNRMIHRMDPCQLPRKYFFDDSLSLVFVYGSSK